MIRVALRAIGACTGTGRAAVATAARVDARQQDIARQATVARVVTIRTVEQAVAVVLEPAVREPFRSHSKVRKISLVDVRGSKARQLPILRHFRTHALM